MRRETADAIAAEMHADRMARYDLESELEEAERLEKFWKDKAADIRKKLADFDD
jgi:precorrin-2 methylase